MQVAHEGGQVALARIHQRGAIGAQEAGGVLEVAPIGVDRVVRRATFGAQGVEKGIDATIVEHAATLACAGLWDV